MTMTDKEKSGTRTQDRGCSVRGNAGCGSVSLQRGDLSALYSWGWSPRCLSSACSWLGLGESRKRRLAIDLPQLLSLDADVGPAISPQSTCRKVGARAPHGKGVDAFWQARPAGASDRCPGLGWTVLIGYGSNSSPEDVPGVP